MEMDTPQTFPLLQQPFYHHVPPTSAPPCGVPFFLKVFSRQIFVRQRLMQDDVRHAIKDLGCKMKKSSRL